MRKMLVVLLMTVLIGSTEVLAGDGQRYGEKLKGNDLVSISDLIDNPKVYVGKNIRVTGKVVGVCEHQGCWIDIAGTRNQEKIRFKVDDGVIVFPMTVKGKDVIAEGIFEELVLSEEQAIQMEKHHAEERGEECDPTTVTEPMTIYRIKGNGALID
jgi:hypothetical protein